MHSKNSIIISLLDTIYWRRLRWCKSTNGWICQNLPDIGCLRSSPLDVLDSSCLLLMAAISPPAAACEWSLQSWASSLSSPGFGGRLGGWGLLTAGGRRRWLWWARLGNAGGSSSPTARLPSTFEEETARGELWKDHNIVHILKKRVITLQIIP